MTNLYRAHSIIRDFQYADCVFYDVSVVWCVTERETPVIPYENGINNYNQKGDTTYEETALNEHFTYREALALCTFLFEEKKIECRVEEAELPICKYCVRCYHLNKGYDAEGCIDLHERPGYDLPIKVTGYFTVTGSWAEQMTSETQLKSFSECWN